MFLYTLGTLRNYLQFEEKSKGERDEGSPCSKKLAWPPTGKKGAEDTTGRERFEDSANV